MKISTLSRNLRLGACLCLAVASSAAGFSARAVTFKQQSLLRSGKWVRVNVSRTGIQQISHDQLRALGIDPAKATVYGTPTTDFLDNSFSDAMPDDLLPTYSESTDDGRLLFYGEGPAHYDLAFNDTIYAFDRKISTFTDHSAYFITDSQPAKPAREVAYTPSSTFFTTHASVTYIENELENYRSVGAFMWDQAFAKSSVRQQIGIKDFATDGVPSDGSDGRQTFKAATLTQTFMAKVNDVFLLEPVAPSGWEIVGKPATRSIFGFATRTLIGDGSYAVAMQPDQSLTDSRLSDYNFSYLSYPTPASGIRGEAYTDYRAMIYPRHNEIPADGQLEMFYAAGKKGENVVVIGSGTGASIRVWDVTDPADIAVCQLGAASGGMAQFSFGSDFKPGDNARRYVAFDASAQLITPEIAGVVANQNLHAAPVPDFLIITTEDLLPFARELAEYHRDFLGQDVAVYTQQQVFNEFSSGAPAAMAYRRLAKMLYDRNPSKFRNLLLYGPGLWDNRQITMKPSFESLLTYQTEQIVDLTYSTAYVADSYFGMLDDGFSVQNICFEPVHIGVGRIPATTATDARSINNKIYRYLSSPMPAIVANSILMVSDAGDETEHIKQSEQAAKLILENRPGLTVHKTSRAAYDNLDNMVKKVTETISGSLTSGVSLFAYSGHGNSDGFCWDKGLNTATDYEYPPFTMLSTCDPFSFHILANSMAESMLFKEHGGAIAVVGAMCSVYLPYNQYYNLSVLDSWSSAKAGDTYGDMLVNAKQYMLNNFRSVSNVSQMFTNSLCFNFCGDPALTIPTSAYGARIDKVDGAVAPDQKNVLPRVPVALEGSVTNPDGTVNTSFNGDVTLYLYEAPITATTRVESGQSEAFNFKDDSSLLAQLAAKVKDGRFSATLVAPQPQVTGQCRLLITAENAENDRAQGVYNGLSYGFTAPGTPGQASLPAPEITELYFNTPDCGNGSMIPPTSRLVVKIDAPAGLNCAESNIGFPLRVTLDGNQPVDKSLIAVTAEADGKYTVTALLRNLTIGHHDIAVSVADNSLNRVDAAAVVTVGTASSAILSVEEGSLPARESLTFNLETESQGSAHRLIVQNAKRETVFTRDVTFPYEWNLTDAEGQPVEEGFYEAFVICSGSPASSTNRLPVTVIR